MTSPLATVLRDAFGDVERFPAHCWVRLAVAEDQDDFGPVIETVNACGERASLIRRIAAEHPVYRPHHEQHDDRLLDAFTEAEALAWAQRVGGLGCCRFIFAEGAPDLQHATGWIEVKQLLESELERAELRRLEPELERVGFVVRGARAAIPMSDAVRRQLDGKLEDALAKWRRQGGTGQLTVFLHARTDFGVSIRRARDALQTWARNSGKRSGARIVVCYMDAGDWRHPLVDLIPD